MSRLFEAYTSLEYEHLQDGPEPKSTVGHLADAIVLARSADAYTKALDPATAINNIRGAVQHLVSALILLEGE